MFCFVVVIVVIVIVVVVIVVIVVIITTLEHRVGDQLSTGVLNKKLRADILYQVNAK